MIKAKNTLKGKLNVSIVKEYPELESITITPTLEEQKLKSEKYGFGDIKVERIPATDITIIPTIEEQIKTGIFKEVKVNAIEGKTLNLNPSEEQQNYEGVFLGVHINPIQVEEKTTDLDFSDADAIEITAEEGKYIKKTKIDKDDNLIPENIKSGVNIYGIVGNLADTNDADATADDILLNKTAYVANTMLRGTYKPLDTSDATATAEDIAQGKIAYVNGEKVVGTAKINNYYNARIDTDFANAKYKSLYQNTEEYVRELNLDEVDFSIWSSLANMFSAYFYVLKITGTIDCSKVSSASCSFAECQTIEEVPILINTQKIKNFSCTYQNCRVLKKINQIDASGCTNIDGMFNFCYALEDFGGLLNLGKSFTATTANKSSCKLNLSYSENLTHDSLMNVINGLYNLNLTYDVANGGTLYTQSLVLGSTNLAKLTSDEIAIATNKGWIVS